jgi:hypothetical protein
VQVKPINPGFSALNDTVWVVVPRLTVTGFCDADEHQVHFATLLHRDLSRIGNSAPVPYDQI